jgi:CAAX prenyl protease-like protein
MVVLAIRGFVADASAIAGVDTRWLYLVQAVVALAALLAWRASYRELAVLPRLVRPLFISIGAGIGVFLLWITPVPGWMHLGASVASFVPVDADGTLRWDLIAARAFGAVLVVPLMEELFWRSFLMRWIEQRDFLSLAPASVSWFAVLTSSLVFALAHELWLAGLVAGLVYAQLYRRLGNLWYAVLAHATTNLALGGWVVSQRAWPYW